MAAIITCLHCGGDLDGGDRFCARCGLEALACPACGHQLLPDDHSCPQCGTPGALETTPAAPDGDGSALTDIIERLRRATLGEFEIGRELGRGGMAAVFLAHEISLDRKVAIKVMSPGLLLGEGMVERFKHEAITIAQLHHPHIVSVYSVRQAEGLHFFVMRYVQGRSLEQVLQQSGRLPLPIARSILHQVGSALAYAHRARVVHRDIKPANILIDVDGNAIVTDFGIAKAAERPSRTLTGALVGTPAYMSPEQCTGGEVSGASDQYALGAVAYEMIAGVPPFAGSTLTVMQAHVEQPPRPIAERRLDCPPALDAAIVRMLQKDPAARWPRMADALHALGAEPLADDGPHRTQLVEWAAPSGDAALSDQPTPASPVPRTRASAAGGSAVRPVGGISIVPAPAGFEPGDNFSLVAVIRGQHGTRLPPRAVEWTTDAPSVLRIDGAAGLATALAPGAAVVTATCKGVTARLRVEVAPPRADDIVIEPMNESLHVGDEIRLDATPRDKRGWPVHRPVTWHSADSSIAAARPEGTIAGRAPGTVRITAALDDARASIVIPVLPPRVAAVDIAEPPVSITAGRHVVLDATPLDRQNTALPGRAVLWSTSDASIAVVTAEGWVAALRPGSAVLTATCEGVRASVRIGVTAMAPVARIEPGLVPVPRRRSRRPRRRALLTGAAALLAGGLWLTLRPGPPARNRADGTAAPAGYAGGLIGVDTGTTPVVAITTRPARPLRPDSATTLAAEVRDSVGRVMPGAPIAWWSSDSTVARVDRTTGRVVGVRSGRAQILAVNGAGRDSVVITVRRPGVRAPVVASIALAPVAPFRPGESAVLHAVVRGQAGDTLAAPELTWASSNPRVLSVETLTGLARAHAAGTALILARSGNETALTELRVLPDGPAELRVLGARPMAVRETLALRAAVRDAQGGEVDGQPIAWTSSDTAIATVDSATGEVVGVGPGAVRIMAATDADTTWVRLSVLPRPERLTSGGGADERGADTWVTAGVGECYGALQAGDMARLRSLWHPSSRADEESLRRLGRILGGRGDATPVVGPRDDRTPTIGPEAATVEFSVTLAWHEPSVGPRTSRPLFRAEFVRTAGRWELSSCRIVGSPRL